MLLKLYSIFVLLLDITALIIKSIIALFETLYGKIVPAPEKSVVGEVVLISGTGHGIGRELAFKFGSLGSIVVCVDINKEGNDATAQEIINRGGKAHAYICDVSKREEVQKLGEKIRREVGNVTILVNNAGIMPCHPYEKSSAEEIRKIFDVNVFAHFWMLETFLPSMIENNHGHVVGISSIAGVLGLTNLVPYCASKFAVRGLMEAINEECREDARNLQVRFTTIYPYMVDTGLCQKPKIRFPSLLGLLPVQVAAAHIVTAVRRNVEETSIPSSLLIINNLCRLLPIKVCRLLKDFLDSGVESHD
ncbi:epidermal retinol dehydrogenase 2 isoform X2 [Bemisia tabaci]|nr:PREDICTED: epidermal retinol dehydrogenase 2-like isoform X2 [Bemisia tabaci]